jgi:hypothetical protein
VPKTAFLNAYPNGSFWPKAEVNNCRASVCC